MSNNYWQTKKLEGQYGNGKTLTEKVSAYEKTWESRCYSGGIPDEVPYKVMMSNRAPSYKAIAIAILKNDDHLTSLGFAAPQSSWYSVLKMQQKNKESSQLSLL